MKKFKELPIERILTNFVIVYLAVGLIFALLFAIYYKWEWYGYFSPGFFSVLLTWPFQAIGFIKDLLYFGLGGPPSPFN